MKLNKIYLENIRSYEEQEIEFPEGSTLLSGDIGSGKTSILLAIEFALFGLQPGQRGNSLLKNSAKEGSVKLEFEIDGRTIIIERILKRGKTITQDYCAITIDDVKKELAVTELKNIVLELLNYPKEFSKKQNILYKFTVYTPQEEMKQIILQDSETRINTLRHVFGIDKYKKIIENTSILASKLREEKRVKEALTSNIEQDKLDIISKENDLEGRHHNLVSVEKELFFRQEQRKKIQDEKDEILAKIEEKGKLHQEIEKTKIIIANKNESILNNKKAIEQLKKQVSELQQLKFDESQIIKLQGEINIKKKQKQEISEQNLIVASKIHSLEIKNQENQATKEKISRIEICPTCLQDVDPNYKANVINKLDYDTSENIRKIQELSIEKQFIYGKIKNIDNEISKAEKNIQELNILKLKLYGAEEKIVRINELEKSNLSLEKDNLLLNSHLDVLKKDTFELSKFDNIFKEKQVQLENSLSKERQTEIKVAELKKEIDFFSRQIEELKEKIKNTEKIREQLNYISGFEDWLSAKFTYLISFIEKNVMIKLKAEFSQLFSKWFAMLVSDNFNVYLSDDFTPIIEHQDYEIDYAYLSGGERTAIALAYRLALNQVINSILSKIKTRDLVILDEPTDGFSEQQLDKMRDVLQELNVAQLIIVSHEQKIEGFVENVIRFRKDGGVSRKEI